MAQPDESITRLLDEYDAALAYTDALWSDLGIDEVHWRESDNASAIGWHLGHQAAVAHFMVRNLTAAEPLIDPPLDALMDSATPEPARGDLPDLARLRAYRQNVAERVHLRTGIIATGDVGAPAQLRVVAQMLLVAIINHEYQHSKWIGEVRTEALGKTLPVAPASPLLSELDGYLVITTIP